MENVVQNLRRLPRGFDNVGAGKGWRKRKRRRRRIGIGIGSRHGAACQGGGGTPLLGCDRVRSLLEGVWTPSLVGSQYPRVGGSPWIPFLKVGARRHPGREARVAVYG